MQEAMKTATANPPLPNPNPHYGQGYTYGQPNLRYAVGVGPELPPPQGAKVKLDLAGRNDLNLFQLAQAHISAMAGNLNFTTPFPTAPDFLTVFTNYANALEACDAAKQAQKQATSFKDEQRDVLMLYLNQRGDYVQGASNGNAPVILSSGFGLKAAPTPVGVLAPPINLLLTLNGTPGAMVLSFSSVANARGYLIECSKDVTPRAFVQVKNTSKTSYFMENMEVGETYVFRVAAQGGSTGQSPWSAEVIRGAA